MAAFPARLLTGRTAAFAAAVVLLQGSDFSCTTGDSLAPGGSTVTGVVVFVKVEGGCWRLEADSGERYELRPEQAPSSILVNGARVSVVLELRTDLVSSCQAARPADVQEVHSVRLP
jgi:hypothetical protein